MEVLDRDNLPQEIIDDETSFYETTFLLFTTYHLGASNIDEYFEKYHKDMTFIEFVDKKIVRLKRYFEDFEERSIKAINSTYMRYYMKDLKKKDLFKHISQNYTKKLICMFIAEIIQETNCLCFQNLYKEDYMEIFEESVEEEHLKEEFDNIILQIMKPLFEGKIDDILEKDYMRFCLYKELHAQYIIALNTEGDLENIKEKIRQVLSFTTDEVRKIIEQKEKEISEQKIKIEAELSEKIDQELQDALLTEEDKEVEEEYFKLTKEILEGNTDLDEEEFQDLISSLYRDEETEKEEERVYHKLESLYERYFMYGENKYDEFCEENFDVCRLLMKMEEPDFHDTTMLYMMEVVNDEPVSEMNLYDCIDEGYSQTLDCMHLLAFYLWKQGDYDHQQKRSDGFEKIMHEIPECYDRFLEMREDPFDENYVGYESDVFEFSPSDTYYNHIVLSVILNIDIPSVARRVRKLILSDYNNEYDLSSMSKQLTEDYEVKGINRHNFHKISEFADLYILSYMKDRLLACYSPFMRNFGDLYRIYSAILSPIEMEIMDYLEGYENEDLKFRKDIFSIQKHFDDLFNYYQQNKEKISLSQYTELESIFIITGKSLHFFTPILDVEELLHQHKYELLAYIYRKKENGFLQETYEKQIDELIYVSCLFHFIENITCYEEFMPRKNSIQQQDYINSLKQTIHDKEDIISIKEQQIENLSLSQKHSQKTKKEKSMKLLEDELKYYKQDISSLNKQLSQKDEVIEELKRNQQELYKLRNLLFDMQHEEDIIDSSSVDLGPLIENKTIVIIGGHISTREKMKQKYPSLQILSLPSHITSAVLVHADYVFMFYKFMTHDMYNRAISVLSKNNIPWDYIPYTNLDKSEQEMYRILSES